ncbi:protein SMG8-like isoform X2 [Limulus polyphemus]|uniref:Nonsense-mediated mRNA decay factor SMG8 n=2 Tax=Limulus polyphemus TaxID=6850 RepID=A0ABM1SLD2_LIMPO|nr:protein SMG8-like isoform X1 [Limulus polyphemus]XP_022244439.1 protein SMG8-like isoform X2 [Limulus polyphemus]
MAPCSKINREEISFSVSSLSEVDASTLPRDKVCIVSIFGKSSFLANGCKAFLIDEALGKNIFQGMFTDPGEINIDEPADIQGFYHPESRVIFLHLIGSFDTKCLLQKCHSIENELKEKTFLEVWSDLQCSFSKALLLIFHLSHIILVAHPTTTFDVSYIHLFQTLDSVRQKAVPCLTDLLRSFPISQDWVQAGRPCSPRVLFIFQTNAPEFQSESIDSSDGTGKTRSKKFPPIKRLEHALEDQIYRILRKSRVITNISGNSLFAVPANQEFVYVTSKKSLIVDPLGYLMNQLKECCSFPKSPGEMDPSKSKSYLLNRRGSIQNQTANDLPAFALTPEDGASEHSFKAFLWQHIDLALSKGFDDNVGRNIVRAYFELPTAQIWFQIANKLKNWFFMEPKDSRSGAVMSLLKTTLDIDVRFSEGRCAKVLPLASAAYQDNLPTHYTLDYHERKLNQALQVFAMHARGPAFQQFAQQLEEDCERLWQNGHQMCEFRSLTGNHCINPLHRASEDDEDVDDKTLPIMPHCSQVKMLSACDCGRRQASREDPFEVKAANYSFYSSLHDDCCGKLERIKFPVFTSTTGVSRPAQISPVQAHQQSEETRRKRHESQPGRGESQVTTTSMSLALSFGQPGSSDMFPTEESAVELSQGSEESPRQTSDQEVIISLRESKVTESPEKCTGGEKLGVLRQPSTTEYLPGMLHSESPLGLLPMFPSWSLICLGPSSLYSHNIGIQEQPGFIPGTNFLLPWDVTVKLEHKDRWPTVWDGKRPHTWKTKKGGKDGSQFTVKIFIGVEYECPRGHRFMCSAPDKVLRATSSGLVKDNANKITGNDMPLYFPCPCRGSKHQVAQLIRIHVVTPKAPVHVTLNPRVQAAPPPSPVFSPGNSEPVKLSQSAYWVLRLPFVYQGDQGPYLPPKDPVPVEVCHLLKGTYDIAEQISEKS